MTPSTAEAQPRLEDLWAVGKPVTLDDGQRQVTVWLQKLGAPDMELCWRKAASARAKVLAGRDDPESDIYGQALSTVYDYADRATLIAVAIAEELDKAIQSTKAQLQGMDDGEWAKDGYLQGLRDAWLDPTHPLAAVYLRDPEDPEAKRVYDELQRFDDQVGEAVAEAKANLEESYGQMVDAELVPLCVKRHVQVRADQAWGVEFERAQLWRAVRRPSNHDDCYFADRAGVDRLSDECRERLIAEYKEMLVGVVEGKDSQEAQASSPPSAPPAEAETEQSSGLVTVGA